MFPTGIQRISLLQIPFPGMIKGDFSPSLPPNSSLVRCPNSTNWRDNKWIPWGQPDWSGPWESWDHHEQPEIFTSSHLKWWCHGSIFTASFKLPWGAREGGGYMIDGRTRSQSTSTSLAFFIFFLLAWRFCCNTSTCSQKTTQQSIQDLGTAFLDVCPSSQRKVLPMDLGLCKDRLLSTEGWGHVISTGRAERSA